MDEPNTQAKAKPVPAARLFRRNGIELFGRMERKKPKNSSRWLMPPQKNVRGR
jgi:hypothetical protein